VSDPVWEARQELIRLGLLADVRPDGVPELIVRSWRRSIGSSVEASALSQRYQEVDADSILRRAAAPVLDRWQDQLADTGTTLFLSDRAGSIVARRTSDSSLLRRLDRVHAAEGFDYSEGSIGTNGLGTSMVEKRAVYIQGSQHYSDVLATLACAAAPVCAPSGSVLGSVSLGGPIEAANPLMLSVTQEIGRQIEERLRTASRPQDLALAMSLMRFTNSERPTVVMDGESLLANTPGVPYVSVSSHVALWELLNAHDWATGSTARILLEGTAVAVNARRVDDGPRAHFVLHFADLAAGTGRAVARPSPPRRAADTTAVGADGLLVVEGPRGSGRASAARSLRTGRPDDGLEVVAVSPTVATPWAAVDRNLQDGSDVLLRRVDEIAAEEVAELLRLVDRHRAASAAGLRSSCLVVTVDRARGPVAVRAALDRPGPAARTEALSARPERIPGLVKGILDRVDPDRRHTVSPAALQALMQWTWPGNITELVEVLERLVREVPASVIQCRHLPQHLQQAPPRRRVGLIEAAEREAIIRALDAAAGNKSEAAGLLGIGRTTLYRRIRQLGLDGYEGSL